MEHISVFLSELFFLVTPVFRLVFVFLFSYIEGLPILGSLFPGGTIALLVGALSQDSFINPSYAILFITFGSFFGDMTGFLLGRKLKHQKWIKKIIEHEKHQKKWDVFDRQIVIIAIFGRILPFVRSLPSLFAGARNIKVQKYSILSFIGSFVWALTGIYGGRALFLFTGKLAIPIILGILILSGLITLIINYNKSLKNKKPPYGGNLHNQ